MNRCASWRSFVHVLALSAAVLAACGSGGTASPRSPATLRGVASGGVPLAAARIHVEDARGTRLSAAVGADGAFQVDVSGLTPPFLLEATGMVGGRPATLHSVALAGDVGGRVDVTPLTELVTAWVLQGNPADSFNAAPPDLSRITADRTAEGQRLVSAKASALLSSFGAGGVDLRTGEVGTGGAGMSGALQALRLTPVQGRTGTVYEFSVLGAPPVVVDPVAMDEATLGAVDAAGVAAIEKVLPQIDAQLQALAAQFQGGVPSAAAVAQYFVASGFHHNGLDLPTHLSRVLLTEPFAGMRITPVALEQIVSDEEVVVSYGVLFAQPAFPRAETTRMRLVGGRWLSAGNDAPAAVGVNYLARLFSRPLGETELAALPGVRRCPGDTAAYCMDVLGYGHNPAWIGHADEENFGALAYAGSNFDSLATPAVDERFLQRRFSRFIGIANGRVRPYLVFNASTTEVDPRVHHIVVTGPGLPDTGLTLVQPRANVPRPYFPIQGDYMDWNSFNTERCQNFGSSAPASCALDWSRVVAGATYHYSFRDAGNVELGTAEPRLLGQPRTPEEWFAGKDRYFPQLRLPADAAFTLFNVFDDSEGSPFTGGGSVTVGWSAPSDPQVALESLWVWRNYYVNDDPTSAANERKESHTYSLVGSTATSQTTTYEPVAFRTSWAWATLTARDQYGNSLENEVSPVNPSGAPCDAQNGPPICQQKAFRLPPRTKAARTYPKLVNYFHRMDRAEAQIAGREEYLAQWDVLVLNPQNVTDQGLSLARIRAANPDVKILAWVPMGQSSGDMDLSQTMPNLEDYYLRTAGGQVIRWAWGGYLMNPYKNGFAFADHVVEYLEAHYLVPGGYDGIMFDCLFGVAPTFLSPDSPQTVDVNEDGRYVAGWDTSGDDLPASDDAAYRAGIVRLLSRLRADRPDAILTGNNAFPWWQDCPYYAYVDGDMRENAFGDEPGLGGNLISEDGTNPYGFQDTPHGDYDTAGEWQQYTWGVEWITRPTPYFFVQADTQYGRTACVGGGECALDSASLAGLSHDDQRRFRLALATTLLRDGYFAFDRGDGLHGQLFWFPEYDVDLGDPAPGYERTSAQGTVRANAYGPGTYSREFVNGTVIVNPTGAAAQVTFPQARTDASTGQTGTTFRLPPHDGRIYVKG